jgi:broad specificity phosphatase PhoE
MRLLLARHAPTDWNAAGRFQGQEDIALGATGKRLASLLGERLAGERIDEIQTSDLLRARETASAVSGARRLPTHTDPRLRELHFGTWQGRTYDEVRQAYPEALPAWEADSLGVAPPGGETLAQLASRIDVFLGALTAGATLDRTVLVVAHQGSLQVLLCLALGLSPRAHWKFRLEPAALSELNLYPEGAIVNFLNDTHHLRQERSNRGSGRFADPVFSDTL